VHILDLDLDFFLNDVAYHKNDDSGKRLDPRFYKPWPKNQVRSFVEKRCGLSIDVQLKGKIVEHHDEALYFWQYLIENSKISVPFDVTHVDSHNDLGLGDSGYRYLMSDLLYIDPEDRPHLLQRAQVEPSNFLAFAIACRWITNLVWVHHPGKAGNLIVYHSKDFDTKSGIIQLKKLERNYFDDDSKTLLEMKSAIISIEPEVVFKEEPWEDFKATVPFDYMVLSKSPGYTPLQSDKLIPLIKTYMKPM